MSRKPSNNWRLVSRLELIEIWLSSHRAVNLKHICWDGNKVANLLANIGVESGRYLHTSLLSMLATEHQLLEYKELVKNEMAQEEEAHPDVGDHRGI